MNVVKMIDAIGLLMALIPGAIIETANGAGPIGAVNARSKRVSISS